MSDKKMARLVVNVQPSGDRTRFGAFPVVHRLTDQVQDILDGRSVAPTDVYSSRGDEILERLRRRIR